MPQLNTTISSGLWQALLDYAERTQEPEAHIVSKALTDYLQVAHHTLSALRHSRSVFQCLRAVPSAELQPKCRSLKSFVMHGLFHGIDYLLAHDYPARGEVMSLFRPERREQKGTV